MARLAVLLALICALNAIGAIPAAAQQVAPTPILTLDAVDFINQPATVDLAPLLERMPRRLTPLEDGLATYLSPASAAASVVFDAPAVR